MKRSFYSMPVKFGLFSLIISLIGMLGIGLMTYDSSADLLEKQALKRLNDDLKREESLLLEKVKTLKDDLNLLSNNASVSGVLRAYRGDGYDDSENMTLSMWQQRLASMATTVMQQRDAYQIVQLKLLDADQRYLLNVERHGDVVLPVTRAMSEASVSAQEAFLQIKQFNSNGIWISKPQLLRQGERIAYPPQSVLYIGKVIRDRRWKAYAVLMIQIDFDQLTEDLRKDTGPITYFVANDQGMYLSHPKDNRNWSYELNPDISIRKDYPELGPVSPGIDSQYLNHAIEGHSGDQGVVLRHIPLIEEGFAEDLLLGAVTNLEYLHQESAGLLKNILILMFIAGLVLAVATAMIAYHITRPLLRLKLAADQISAGDRDTHIPVDGDDEIASLGQSIHAMLQHLNISQQELAEMNNSLEHKVASRTAELEDALEQANAATVAKAQFLATMSHEIRTPLNGVLGMTELLLSTPLNTLQRRHLKTVKRSGETLLNLLNDILDLSKIEAGKLNINISEFNPNELIENCVLLYADSANRKGLEVIPSTLPSLSHHLKGDPDRINQVLMNLINNGIKFTNKGEVVVGISILDEDQDRVLVRFKVQDTGIGISDAAQKTLFQKFVQLDSSSTRQYGGTGLGLAISRQLVELMGGEIQLDSIEGQGSRIWFDLPLKKGVRNIDLSVEHEELLSQTDAYIVDDNSTNRELLHHIMASWGVNNEAERDSLSALDHLLERAKTSKPYQLLLLDQMMPNLSGMELAQMIRRAPELNDLKIIMLSSSDLADEGEINACGINYYLRKPFRQSELYNAVVSVLTGEGENQQAVTQESGLQGLSNQGQLEALAKRRGQRILLVEDTPVNQQVSLGMLKQLGFDAELAENGAEAVSLYQQKSFDLILMDIQMPVMDGYEATSSIRGIEQKTGHSTSIVALTAHAMGGDREKCIEKGMDDHLSKPLSKQSLIDVLLRWLPEPSNSEGLESTVVSFSPVVEKLSLDIEKQFIPEEKQDPVQSITDNSSDKQILNQETLSVLKNNLGQGSLKPLLTTFVSGLPDLEQSILAAYQDQDYETMRKSAHRLKGSAYSLGAERTGELAEKLESAAKDQKDVDLSQLMKNLDTDIKQLTDALASAEVEALCHDE